MSVTNSNFNPSGNARVDSIKLAGLALEAEILKVEPGRRRSVALTQLETCLMWAVAAEMRQDE